MVNNDPSSHIVWYNHPHSIHEIAVLQSRTVPLSRRNLAETIDKLI